MTKGLKALVAWPLAVLLVVGLPGAGLAEDRRTAPCRLNVMTFNAEFLWDGVESEEGSADFAWKGSQTEAEDHMRLVADVIKRSNPDIVNLVEVENLQALTTFNDKFLAGRGYRPYFVQGKDTSTGQDVVLLTRIDPDGNAIARDDRKGRAGNVLKSVSKNYFAKLTADNVKIAFIGLHFLARPDDESRRLDREAQADAIRNLGKELHAQGFRGIVFGDFNDYDGDAGSRDHIDSTPITNVPTSVITGDVGLSPAAGSNITGLTAAQVLGTIYAVDATGPAGSVNNPTLLTAAKNALTAAYLDAAGRTPVSTVASQLGGTTKTHGVYNTADGELGIAGTLTLDAQGDPDAVFVFKAASTLITSNNSNVSLINGAQACNVFWQVGSSATLGTNSTFKGNILALTSATLTTGANVEGRVLARNGAVTLDSNVITKATCALPPPPPPVPIPTTSFAPVPPLISVTKVPSPLALPSGPGPVTYTYTVRNIGYVEMNNVTLGDDKCSPVIFVSGDTDNDSRLDIPEVWTYRCAATISKTTQNTATVTGRHPDGGVATDVAIATVVVGLPTPPPLINVIKKTTSLNMLVGGGPMTYTYTVTNPGTAPLSNVSVIDDKCTGLPGRVVGHPGDLNKNNLLESNESWTFTCQTNLTKTTTNTATAEGHANGLTAIDFALATVVVAPPKLPATGIAPDETSIPWNIIIPAGMLLLVSTSLGLVLRKRTV